MMRVRRLWWGVSIMVIIALLLMALFEWGPRRELAIVPSERWLIKTIDDRIAGGSSVATLGDDGVELNCQLSADYRWPYCELMLTLSTPEQGLDLSGYDSMIIRLQGEGPTNSPWRIYLRNYHPDYSIADDPVSHKVNGIMFDPAQYPGRVEVPLSLFTPTTWWLTDYDIPLLQQGQDLTRVFAIELATGSGVVPGHYRLRVEEMLFRGYWMTPALFYRGLFLGWSCIVIALLLDYVGMRRRLQAVSLHARQTMQRNQDLEEEFRIAADLVRHDPLTGALSRSEGERRLNGLEGKLVVIFIDIDRFKQINDGYGHSVGDEVLKSLVSELQFQLPHEVSLCRWGGEEFVLLASGRPLSWGAELADRLRSQIDQYQEWPEGLQVTASFGVAEREEPESWQQTLARADEALYQAKRGGRNRVAVAA